MDIYFRFKDQVGNDYCFNVDPDSKVGELKAIFEKTPIMLSPSYFYKSVPKGFAVSTHPGFYSCTGAMLFAARATERRYLKPLNNDLSIKEQVVEGQLIVPLWEHNSTRELAILLFLSVWLYWDLPDFLSPTPGYCLTSMIGEQLGMQMDVNAELVFFGFNLFKVIGIYAALWSGVWHPITLKIWKIFSLRKQMNVSAKELEQLGWTGVKRITPTEWQMYYQKQLTSRSGGAYNAVLQGVYKKSMGVSLTNQMGWAVLRDNKLEDIKVNNNLLDKNGLFVVSRDYLAEVKSTYDSRDPVQVKNFRKFGYVNENPKLVQVFETLIEQSK